MKQKDLNKIEAKMRSVIRSCKNKEQLEYAYEWIRKIYYVLNRLNISRTLFDSDWVRWTIREQKDYIEKVAEVDSLEINMEIE
jgi:hypothetical protein